jgi:hypothetical protein
MSKCLLTVLPDDENRSSFQNFVFCSEFFTKDEVQSATIPSIFFFIQNEELSFALQIAMGKRDSFVYINNVFRFLAEE